ncbi:MAG TPA: DUF3108 domain-containing protein [Roseimicrobium sp.]|nr:DUF3108 domain-containing protein [Roseimicrobium sp.]
MQFARILLLSLLILATARADGTVTLLQPGETLTYRVGWGMLGHAGEIQIGAKAETDNNKECIRITTTTSTRGFVRALYPFDGDASILFDAGNGLMLSGSATTKSSKKNTHASITFDYDSDRATYVDHVRSKRSITLDIPPDSAPVDLITSLIQDRTWSLTPGQSRETLVLFDDEFYPLQITAECEETISTPSGPRKTVVLVPRMTGTPKGMFRRGGEVRVWVSADKDRLPLRFEVKLKVGTAYAVLTDYHPPS